MIAKKPLTKSELIYTIILTLPFLLAIVFILLGLFILSDIYLETGFGFNFKAILTLFFIHLSSILILKKLKIIVIELPDTLKYKIIIILGSILFLFLSNLLLGIGSVSIFNYWLRNDKVENIELIVVDKYISNGKATDYYIIFDSKNGKLTNRVKRRNYEKFSIGEIYQVKVNKGYFEGYFFVYAFTLLFYIHHPIFI